MKIKICKTDGRHLGFDKYKFYISITATYGVPDDHIEKFYEIRQWCWDTWGAAREVNEWRYSKTPYHGDRNPHWSWINDGTRRRIYLRSKDEAMLVTLKWI